MRRNCVDCPSPSASEVTAKTSLALGLGHRNETFSTHASGKNGSRACIIPYDLASATTEDPMDKHPLRIVLAKVGLDGHDRGIKVVARALRDAGMHVIYAGLWQTPEAVARTVAEEDADWLGLSLLSGAHLTLVPRVMEALRENNLGQVNVMLGGIIPETDIPRLQAMGIAQVFGPGTSLDDIVAYLKKRSEADHA
jgi:methylmalonyl-CoA mutase cobalamin-binding domain/chain